MDHIWFAPIDLTSYQILNWAHSEVYYFISFFNRDPVGDFSDSFGI